ncbi:MAG: pyridoxal kinase, partial [Phycicoccus sp.]
ARTVSSVFDLLSRTLESGRRELQLVQSQDAIATPRMQFEVGRLR